MQQPPNPYPQYPQQQWQPPSQPLTPQQWQQQPDYMQPQAYYPPQTPFPSQQEWPQSPQNRPPESQRPPTKPPARRSKTWLWLIMALVVGIVIGYAIHVPSSQSSTDSTTTTTQDTAQATSQPTQVPTPTPPAAAPTPTHTPKWTTVQTFSGSGNKKTAIFNTPNDWKIIWSCNPASDYLGEYNLSVDVNNSDGTPLDYGAINEICKAGNTTNSTEEHQGGQVYLDIQSDGGTWTIQVQELK